ncbi:MAG: cysteine hydrolase family protein [Hyphomicrobiaceae bacterium]
MSFVGLGRFKDSEAMPLLILVDLQQEYLCETRPLGLDSFKPVVENCRKLLTCARSAQIPVAFVRWLQGSLVFNPNERFSDWIDGFSPAGSDMTFERSLPSCYSSSEFSRVMDQGGGRNAVIAGFTGSVACLATIVEGSSYRHKYTFVEDASTSHVIRGNDEKISHEMATSLISTFAQVTITDDWIKKQNYKATTDIVKDSHVLL